MTAISQGGPAKRVKVLTDADLKANGGAYALEGRAPVAVYGVTDAETKAQGGPFAVEGNPAQAVYVVAAPAGAVEGTVAPLPVIGVTGGPAQGGAAIPVYVVGGSLGGGAPDAPANLALAIGNAPAYDEIDILWDASAGATLYRVRYGTNGSDWTEIDTTAGTTYTLTSADYDVDAVTHYVEVRAENGDGNSAYAQATISGLLPDNLHRFSFDTDDDWSDSIGTDEFTETGTVGTIAGKLNNAANIESGERLVGDAGLQGSDYSLNAPRTLAFWFYIVAEGTLIAKRNPVGLREWELYCNTTGAAQILIGNSAIHTYATATANTWHSLIIQSDGVDAVQFRLDGGAWQTYTGVSIMGTQAEPVYIGIGETQCRMDEFSVWGRELSDNQCAAWENGGNGRAYPYNA